MTISVATSSNQTPLVAQPSMFPIIPHHFFKTSSGDSSPSTSRLVTDRPAGSPSTSEGSADGTDADQHAGKVTAATDIPRDAVSDELQPKELCRSGKEPTPGQEVKVSVSRDGRLRPVGPHSTAHAWVRRIRLAGDCHSYNVLLRVLHHGGSTLVLQAVRPVPSGEELLLWFSEQLLALVTMPFLVPANIQGEKRYVCHLCGRHYEIPNPLKIHLALECGRLKLSHLWKRLAKQLVDSQPDSRLSPSPFIPLAFHFELRSTPHPSHTSSSKAHSGRPRVKASNPAPATLQDSRPVSEPITARHSAFKPYWNRRRAGMDNRPTPMNYLHNLSPSLLSNRILCEMPDSHYRKHDPLPRLGSPITHTLSNPLLRSQQQRQQHQNQPAIVLMPQHQRHLPAGVDNYHSHAAEMETLVSNLGKSKQGHLCIYCGKIYSRKYGLKIHIRTHTGYKPLKCKYCLRPFGDPSNLNKHVRLHAEGETPYKCDLCGKVLVRRRDLERHIKSRHSPQSEEEEETQDPSSN